jgi:hypothetical protein
MGGLVPVLGKSQPFSAQTERKDTLQKGNVAEQKANVGLQKGIEGLQ